VQNIKERIMPVIRTFIARVKPGRMQDVVTHLGTLHRLALEAGATAAASYNILTGPLFPGLTIHGGFEDLAAYGRAREQVLAHPEGAQLFAADAPIDIVNASLAEPVYRAGPPLRDVLAQTQVRYSIILRPHRGRGEDVVRRLSRLADTAHQCGALTVAVRRVIAGSEGPRLNIHAYHAGFAEFESTRAAVMESDVWNALSRSQDEAATRVTSVICTKFNV
jgi:hypothetical protein